MSHLIEEHDNMFSVREVPWHGLGIVLDDAPLSEVAIIKAGLDWTIEKTQLHLPDGSAIPNYYANVRSDTRECLGLVHDRYSVIQNAEAFSFLDSLVNSGNVRYETVGSLRNGRTIWMQARLQGGDFDRFNLLGDKTVPYIFLSNTHDGTGSVRVAMTPVRIVCNNTLNLATSQATRSWSTTHVGDFQKKLIVAQETLMQAGEYLESLQELSEQMVQIKLTADTIAEILHTVYPHNDKAGIKTNNTMQKRRDGIINAMKAEDIAKFNGTGWQLIQATTDFLQHSEPLRVRSANPNLFYENRLDDVVKGDPMMDAITKLILAA